MNQDLATIIRLTKLTETSLIVTWISQTHGLIKTVAKGARRTKSPYRGKLDLFYQAEICWHPSKASSGSNNLHTLAEVKPTNYREKLRKSYANTELAAYFCTLLESVVEPDLPADGFLDLLDRGLNYLCEQPADLRALRHFERETCKLLGIFTKTKSSETLLLSVVNYLPKNRSRCLELLGPEL